MIVPCRTDRRRTGSDDLARGSPDQLSELSSFMYS